MALRHQAFATVPRRPRSELPAEVEPEEPPGPLSPTHPDDLTVDVLRRGLAHHGCVLVRGLIPAERAEALARGIDRALDAFDACADEPRGTSAPPWYVPFDADARTYRVGGRRAWVRASGALWTADSPRMLFELLDVVDATGIGALVEGYFGERPALSANKCTLRRVPVDASTNWHQDGAFLGRDVTTLNLWLALSPCGAEAPGLDIVPRRFDHILPTGTDGALFDWSVSPTLVEEAAGGADAIVRPEFEPGDALLFDHLFVHRTARRAQHDPRAVGDRELVLRPVDLSGRPDPPGLLTAPADTPPGSGAARGGESDPGSVPRHHDDPLVVTDPRGDIEQQQGERRAPEAPEALDELEHDAQGFAAGRPRSFGGPSDRDGLGVGGTLRNGPDHHPRRIVELPVDLGNRFLAPTGGAVAAHQEVDVLLNPLLEILRDRDHHVVHGATPGDRGRAPISSPPPEPAPPGATHPRPAAPGSSR